MRSPSRKRLKPTGCRVALVIPAILVLVLLDLSADNTDLVASRLRGINVSIPSAAAAAAAVVASRNRGTCPSTSRSRAVASALSFLIPSVGGRRRSASLKSRSCPLWSSSFSFCLHLHNHYLQSRLMASSTSTNASISGDNPLLQDFVFPPFDVVQPRHIVPGIRQLLSQLEADLVQLEETVEPAWPKLVEPLERIVDHPQVAWGIVNHLKAVKDSSDLRAAIDEVQPEKVKFLLRLGQSKPIYNAFKAMKESSSWSSLPEARKRIVEDLLLH